MTHKEHPPTRLGALMLVIAALAPSSIAHAQDELSRARAIKTAAREVAREEIDKLLRMDDFDDLYCLSKRWETHLDALMSKQLLVECLRKLDSTKPLQLNNPPKGWIGTMTLQDLSIENGRCAWAIEQLLHTTQPTSYSLHFEPIDEPVFFNSLDKLRLLPEAVAKMKSERWKFLIFNEENNKDLSKLDEQIDLALPAVIEAMELPARMRKKREIPTSNPLVIAYAEVEALFRAGEYQTMRRLPPRWIETLSESTLKHLILRLMLDLKNSEKPNYVDPNGLMFVNHSIWSDGPHNSETGEVLDQDVYSVNGRTAWALEKLLKTTLPPFNAKLVEDKKKLKESIRQAHYRVIEAMDLPEKPWVKKNKDDE